VQTFPNYAFSDYTAWDLQFPSYELMAASTDLSATGEEVKVGGLADVGQMFEPTRTERATGMISLNPKTVLVTIGMGEDHDNGGFTDRTLYWDEKKPKLSDVWEEDGKVRNNVPRNGPTDGWSRTICMISG
jgi:hypothetical protein